MLGKPHNVIRHALMPRCIFKRLWETISSGNEMFAYVVNRTKGDDYYWVLAHVTPDHDADGKIIGYTSCRRAPGKTGLDTMRPLYERLLHLEAATDRKEGLAASVRALDDYLVHSGTPYDQLMHRLIAAP